MEVKSKREARGAETREALLEVAERLFAAEGYAATSVERVVADARVTKGALYHHFADKRELFEAVVARVVRGLAVAAQEESRRRMEAEGGPRRGLERFRAALSVYLERLGDPAQQRILLVDGPSALGRERFDEIWIENSLVAVRRLLGRFDESPGLPPELVDPLCRMLLGAAHEAALTIGHAAEPATARASFEAAFQYLLLALHEKARREAGPRRNTRPR